MPPPDRDAAVHRLLFAPEPPAAPDGGPGALLHRRLVRERLFDAVGSATPLARRLLGDEILAGLVGRWLTAAPPATPLLRAVPSAFAAWFLSANVPVPHPAAAELVHWEALELDVLCAPDPEPADLARAPGPGAEAIFDPSARLVAYRHPVHEVASAWPAEAPAFLLAHRLGERRRTLVLGPGAARLLSALAAAPWERAVAASRLAAAEAVRLVTSLVERGAIAGFTGGSPGAAASPSRSR